MHLTDFAQALGAPMSDLPASNVTGISHNTAWVKPGFVYVAIRGERVDGHTFIPAAQAAGAVAVIGEGLPPGTESPVPYLRVDDARVALARGAAVIAGHPSRRLQVIGITGTDGKTTTSWMTRHLYRYIGKATGLMSTVGYELADGELREFPSHFTTPEAPQVQEILAELVAQHSDAIVLETSSHALAMKRVEAVEFDLGVWTNLSPEHLELHGSMEQYCADKSILIRSCQTAILNIDDPWARGLLGLAPAEVTYSAHGNKADWFAQNVVEHPSHIEFTCSSPLGQFPVVLPMIGEFNIANALAAMAAAAYAGATVNQLQEGMRTFPGVPGRLQTVPSAPTAPRVVIDFAHTALSLDNVLTTLRPSTQGKLWVVFGASGERDTAKRGPMGEVTTLKADIAVFTEDDPRTESVSEIIEQIKAGTQGRNNYVAVNDRTEAITYALHNAAPEDTVLLAGKGPEDFIARGKETYPWDELQTALDALATRQG